MLDFYVDIHTEAVQAALAKHKEEKMALPMPTKRRSAFVQSPVDNCTPPGMLDSSDSEDSVCNLFFNWTVSAKCRM